MIDCTISLQTYIEEFPEMSSNLVCNKTISKLCYLVSNENSTISHHAAYTLSCAFVQEDSSEIIDQAITEGVFDKFLQLLYRSGKTDELSKYLWGLSNISGGTTEHVAAFIQEEELIQRILILIQNKSVAVKCEALFVITNAIS